ncbi:MAG: glycosyltransferase family 4 protein [Paludibacteraceae bacterium]|nr:glycosyltransferase family 4 protein [Paludibacteraceae bacterium]MBR4712900.1 glycosyltransferase family 4 protein [Paludibacteraceae bacterium]
MKLAVFHLFNDYSGSPKVLGMVLSGLIRKGCAIDLLTSRGGVLDELRGDRLRQYRYSYRFSMNPIVTMLRYTYAQVYMFFFSWRYLFKKDITFYINTILPVGAALAGRMMGKRVIYHYHENSFAKSGFYRRLAWAMTHLATEIICVSEFQKSHLSRVEHVHVVPNALPDSFVGQLTFDPEKSFEKNRVLMVASLKKYKGVLQFFELANRLPQCNFAMVLNETQETIDDFVKENNITLGANIKLYPRQDNVAPFYADASMVLNLTDANMAVETFGLTALEAMSAGLPVIVPTRGGVAELVEDGVNGYKIDVCDLDVIEKRIATILSDYTLYKSLSESAYDKSKNYSEETINEMISSIVWIENN